MSKKKLNSKQGFIARALKLDNRHSKVVYFESFMNNYDQGTMNYHLK